MIKVGIISGAGYTAGELIRVLVNHPEARILFVHSESCAGKKIASVHPGLIGEIDLDFTDCFPLEDVDVVFLCGAHGKSGDFWKEHEAPKNLKIIDLAQDFRDESNGYVYGLPEWQVNKIKQADKIANPGCFATAIQLALLPLAQKKLLKGEINVTAITGSTGAGSKPSETTHFSWREGNVSAYKVFEHQHLGEICRNLSSIQGFAPEAVNFVPVRGDFTRGIFATVYSDCELSEKDAVKLYNEYYKEAPFTFVSEDNIDLKQVVNTNKCLLHVEKHGNKAVVTATIDNLLKGASGQAIQNMNIMFGLPQTTGLRLKASAF